MDLRPWLRTKDAGSAPAVKTRREIPAALIDHEGVDWKQFSVMDQPETLTNPVLFLVEPSRNQAIDVTTQALRARLERLGRTAEHFDLDPGFAAARPGSRVEVYRRMEEFFNVNLHRFAVKIGPATEVR
jgi:hypothetical protein